MSPSSDEEDDRLTIWRLLGLVALGLVIWIVGIAGGVKIYEWLTR